MGAKRKSRIKICKQEGCFNEATTASFCRLHYLLNWRRIKEERQKSAAKRLNSYVEKMSRQFPERYVEEIKKDLRTRSFERNSDDSEPEEDPFFTDSSHDDEIKQLIKDLKIEGGF